MSSATDPRYRASVRVTYTVNAPPGGQLPLALQPGGGGPVLEQGQVFSQRIRVQRPTWTDAFQAPVLDDASGRARLRALGGDDYELSFDASGLAVGSFYRPSIRVSAEPLGGIFFQHSPKNSSPSGRPTTQ